MRLKKMFSFFFAIISGFILCFAFPPFKYWFLAWFGFVPILFLMDEKSPGRNFLKGFLSGFVFYVFLLNWIYSVAGFFYLLIAVYLALFWGVFFSLVFTFPERTRILIGACLWYFFEIVVRHLISGFPWIFFSLSQWFFPKTGCISAIIGSNGLSGLIIAANFSLFWMIKYKKFYPVSVTAVIVIILYFAATFNISQEKRDTFIKIAAIQGNSGYFGQNPEESFENYKELTESLKSKYDLVVWPESSYPAILQDNAEAFNYLVNKSRSFPLLVGTMSEEKTNLYNSAYYFNDGKAVKYSKRHLVPFGEYVPGKSFQIIKKIYSQFSDIFPEVTPGDTSSIFHLSTCKFSVLICFENIFPEIALQDVKNHPDFTVVITNDSWYGNSFGPYQHFAHNIFRSYETGRSIVQVSTTGITGLVSPSGDVKIYQKNEKNLFVDGIMTILVPCTRKMKTFYSTVGDVGIFVVFLLITGVCLCRI